jgi:hypothetical protein
VNERTEKQQFHRIQIVETITTIFFFQVYYLEVKKTIPMEDATTTETQSNYPHNDNTTVSLPVAVDGTTAVAVDRTTNHSKVVAVAEVTSSTITTSPVVGVQQHSLLLLQGDDNDDGDDDDDPHRSTKMNARLLQQLQAGAFRSLCQHLQMHSDQVSNMDLMAVSGFCRNCLAKVRYWLVVVVVVVGGSGGGIWKSIHSCA